MFDLREDPWQLNNLWNGGVDSDDWDLYERKMKRLKELKECSGKQCY